MPLPAHWVNEHATSNLNAADRGFSYGDGLFETLRYHRGALHLLPAHLQRLQHGCAVLGIAHQPARLARHFEMARDYLQAHRIDDAGLRLTVSRGVSLPNSRRRGYGAECGEPTIAVSLFALELPWPAVPPLAEVVLCETRLGLQPLLAGLKHCNRLEQVLAAREVQQHGADEGLLRDLHGNLVSAVAGNVFLVIDGSVVTPRLTQSGIAGTVRAALLADVAQTLQLDIIERDVLPAELDLATEIVITNSLLGVQSAVLQATDSALITSTADALRAGLVAWVEAQAA